jgi:hypothetical protein
VSGPSVLLVKVSALLTVLLLARITFPFMKTGVESMNFLEVE